MSLRRQRWSRFISGAVLPLALLAGLLALILPSKALAANSDLILAVLVLATALGISPSRFVEIRHRWPLVVALSVLPFAVLTPTAWALSLLFESPTRQGVLALGLAPTEVAASGLVALAGGEAALALAAVTGSLVVSALVGPVLLATVFAGAGAGGGELVVRFALVVIVPLLIGAGARALSRRLESLEPEFAATSTLAVVVLVYASLSGASGQGLLGPALVGSAAFLVASAVFALAGARFVGGGQRSTVGLAVGTRDFAVAAALAGQAFGPPAAAVAGIYGVLMLIAGAAVASLLRRRNGG